MLNFIGKFFRKQSGSLALKSGEERLLSAMTKLAQDLPKPPPLDTDMLGPEGHKYRRDLALTYPELCEKFVLKVILDNRTCPKCWPLDCVEFDPYDDTIPVLPRHGGCRCMYQGKFKSKSIHSKTGRHIDLSNLFLNSTRPACVRGRYLPDGSVTTIGPRGGEIKKVLEVDHVQGSFSDWLRTKSPQIQRPMFTSELAFKLWQDRSISPVELLDPSTWQPRTDEQLSQLLKTNSP